jgi:hypothetical protein
MPSLALKASINYPFIGPSGPSPYTWVDADGLNWYNRVVGVGGSITNANQAAFDAAFQSMKANANVWAKINQGYFFIGQEAFGTGLFVPFYNSNSGSGVQPLNTSPATNQNITSSSYSKQVGLSNLPMESGINTNIPNRNANWRSAIETAGRSAYTFISNINNYGVIYPFGMKRSFSDDQHFDYQCSINEAYEEFPDTYVGLFQNNGSIEVVSYFNKDFPSGAPLQIDGGFGISDTRVDGAANYLFAGTQYPGFMFQSYPDITDYDNGTITIASINYEENPNVLYSDVNTIVASAFGVGGLDIAALDAIVVTLRSNLT